MPLCLTKYHGEFEYSDAAVFEFPHGLFGFEHERRFLPIEIPAARPIVFLQSLTTQELCFVALPVFVVDREYRLSLSMEDRAELGLPSNRPAVIGEDVLCLALITIQPQRPTTANLMAPIVVSLASRRAVQALSTEYEYSHQHTFLQPAEDAVCS